jgi:hypothetical protein
MLGAILRLDVSSNAVPYTIPGSNPFAGMGGMAEEIWLYGLRIGPEGDGGLYGARA